MNDKHKEILEVLLVEDDAQALNESEQPMIPDEAVEAACKALYESRYADMREWEDLDAADQDEMREEQSIALQAAAPYFRAHRRIGDDNPHRDGDVQPTNRSGGQVIPDEAVEAAKEAMREVTPPPGVTKAEWLAKHGDFALIAGAIAAAAPHLMAAASVAWHESVSEAYVDGALSGAVADAMWDKNPYRKPADAP